MRKQDFSMNGKLDLSVHYPENGLDRLMIFDQFIISPQITYTNDLKIEAQKAIFTEQSNNIPLFNIQYSQRNFFSNFTPYFWKKDDIKIIFDNKNIFTLKKEFSCFLPYLMFCDEFRPHMSVFYQEEGNPYYMGKLVNSYGLSQVEVLGDNLEEKFIIKAKFCQCSTLTNYLPCCLNLSCLNECTIIQFEVFNHEGELITLMEKNSLYQNPGDQLKVTFPQSLAEQDRSLLICAAVFLDQIYFNQRLKYSN